MQSRPGGRGQSSGLLRSAYPGWISAPTQRSRAVAEALASNASVPPGQIKAQVAQGWVTLEGTVEWHYQRVSAEQAVRQLRDVKGVINRIGLKSTARADMVKSRIQLALKHSAELDARRITVETRGHKVIL